MYSQRFGTVPREFKGPTPKAVIIVSTGYVCGGNLSPFPSLVEPHQSVLSPGKQVPKAAGLRKKRLLLADLSFRPHIPYPFPLQPPTTFTTWDLGIFVFPWDLPNAVSLGIGALWKGTGPGG